ncbi:MAG TPA: hypothetical protein PKC71_00905 [Ottowia sp.]|nr:hypothetical protein [Ottowia sp.]
MRAIELFHLRRVRDKPRALGLIAVHAGLPAGQALAVLHAAIGGGRPRLRLADDAAARACIVALAPTGFVARFAAADGYDPARHAQQALLAVLPRCSPGLAAQAGALLLHDDWPEALALAVQHLRVHRLALDADRRRLEQAAIDAGQVCGVPGRV